MRHLALLILVALGCAPAHATPAGNPPNILFIAVDDLNDWVSPLGGHPQTLTPNFDRLAAAGTRFTNAHSQAPLCGPSRASIFTGMRPSTTGIYIHVHDREIKAASSAASRATYLTDYFEQHGYVTLGAGKLLHEGAGDNLLDEWVGHNSVGPNPAQKFHYDNPKTSTDWGAFPDDDTEMPDHQVAAYGVEQLGKPHEKPFFLALGFNRPHVPFYVPQKWFDKFDLSSIQLPPYLVNDLADTPAIGQTIHEAPPTPSAQWLIQHRQWDDMVQAYLACVAFVDYELGRVLDALEASEYADNTIIVLWSDHGYHLGEKDIVAKMTLYEESTRVPLLIAGPGLESGQTCPRTVSLLDLYPTLLELAGLPANPQNEGHSLTPLLDDPTADWAHPALTYWGRNNTAVRTERYRYIRYEDGSEELYDHDVDPNEWTNIASVPGNEAIKAGLAKFIPANQAPMSSKCFFGWNDYWKAKEAEAKANGFAPDLSWSRWPQVQPNLFDTGPFLGPVWLFGDYVYSYSFGSWVYAPESNFDYEGAWVYVMP